MSVAITIASIVIAFTLGIVVTKRAFRRPLTQTDIAALQAQYGQARRSHKPSKAIGRQLVKARTEQIKQECA